MLLSKQVGSEFIPVNGISIVNRHILPILENNQRAILLRLKKMIYRIMMFLSQVFHVNLFRLLEYLKRIAWEEPPDLKIKHRERYFLMFVGFCRLKDLRHLCWKTSKIYAVMIREEHSK